MWITILNVVIFLLLVIFSFSQLSLKSMCKRMGENIADILKNREKEYESEKGRNLATKEDIEEITEKIEQIKSEISFRNKWKQDHIQKREECLIRILHLANKILMSHNRIIIKSRNAYNVDRLFAMIDEIDTYAADISHEGNMLVVDNHQFKDITPATKLVDTACRYSSELSCLANNVANALQVSDIFKNRALANDLSDSSKEMINSLILSQQAQAYVNTPLTFKQPLLDAINEYIIWFEQLYGKGVISQYNITEISTKK